MLDFGQKTGWTEAVAEQKISRCNRAPEPFVGKRGVLGDMEVYTNPNFWAFLPHHLLMTAIVFSVGWALKRAIGRDSSARRFHGEFVFWWAVAGYFTGGIAAPLLSRADTELGLSGFAWFSLLVGWLVGTLQGALVLLRRRFLRPPMSAMMAPDRPREHGRARRGSE